MRESDASGDTRMDHDLLPNWTLVKYRCKCAGLMDVKRFYSMAIDVRNLVTDEGNRFERNTALGAWQCHWAVLRRWCAGILVNMRLADRPFVWRELEFSYCRRLQGAIDANMKVTEGDPEIKSWLFNKSYTITYLMRCGTHRTRAFEFYVRQRTAVRSPIFVA